MSDGAAEAAVDAVVVAGSAGEGHGEEEGAPSGWVQVYDPSELETTWSSVTSAADAPDELFMLIVAERGGTCSYWCEDCVDAHPVLHRALRHRRVVEAFVRRFEYKGNPEYPYRKHALTQVRAIPQLNRYVRRGDTWELVGQLVENDCKDAGKVEPFVAGWNALVTIVHEPSALDAAWATVTATGADTIFLATLAERAPDGSYWCPDCTQAAPVLHEALRDQRVVEALVRKADYVKNPDYAYRSHPLTQTKAIPQLNRFVRHSAGGPFELDGSLVNDDCKDLAKVRSFVRRG